ncbi:MAG: hypothetical protein U9M92_01300 [Patescibacteria group bacterium]|nr:hypothetical protein [Patescibacteria group bacterium]
MKWPKLKRKKQQKITSDPLKRRVRPFRYWRLLLIVWLVLLLINGTFHYWSFRQLETEFNQPPPVVELALPNLDLTELKTTANYWRDLTRL